MAKTQKYQSGGTPHKESGFARTGSTIINEEQSHSIVSQRHQRSALLNRLAYFYFAIDNT